MMSVETEVNKLWKFQKCIVKAPAPDLKLGTDVFLGRSEKETTLFIIKVPLRQLLSDVGSKAMQSKYA